jgi:hypothetical protein
MPQRLSGVQFLNFWIIPPLEVSDKNFREHRPRKMLILGAPQVVIGTMATSTVEICNMGVLVPFNCPSVMGTSPAAKSPTSREMSSIPLTVRSERTGMFGWRLLYS